MGNTIPMSTDFLDGYKPTAPVRAEDIAYAETKTSDQDALRQDLKAVAALAREVALGLRKTHNSGQPVEWGALAPNKSGDSVPAITQYIQSLLSQPQVAEVLPPGVVQGTVTQATGAGVFVKVGSGKTAIIPKNDARFVQLGQAVRVTLLGENDPFGHPVARFA